MAPLVVGGNRLAESGVVFSVQGIERVLCVLESLDLCAWPIIAASNPRISRTTAYSSSRRR